MSRITPRRHLRRAMALMALPMVLLLALPAWGGVIVDSDLTPEQAIEANQPPDTPQDVLRQLTLVPVLYFGLDGLEHQGQVVVHKALAGDIRRVFEVILATRFPLESVLPVAHPLIQAKGPYGLSPDTNNTSAYAWRPITGGGTVSLHALGLAIDINPRLNPYRKGDLVLPPGAAYDPARPGTLTTDSPVVREFKRLGWEWGGDWGARGKVDFMHFQKVPAELAPWVKAHGR